MPHHDPSPHPVCIAPVTCRSRPGQHATVSASGASTMTRPGAGGVRPHSRGWTYDSRTRSARGAARRGDSRRLRHPGGAAAEHRHGAGRPADVEHDVAERHLVEPADGEHTVEHVTHEHGRGEGGRERPPSPRGPRTAGAPAAAQPQRGRLLERPRRRHLRAPHRAGRPRAAEVRWSGPRRHRRTQDPRRPGRRHPAAAAEGGGRPHRDRPRAAGAARRARRLHPLRHQHEHRLGRDLHVARTTGGRGDADRDLHRRTHAPRQ